LSFSLGEESSPSEPDQIQSLTEEDLETMGLKWQYKRPVSANSGDDGPSTAWKLRWSPDGTKIAVVYFDSTTLILDSTNGKVLHTISSDADSGSSRATNINSVAEPDPGSRCWGFSSNPMLPVLRACAWSPDGKELAVSGDHTLIEIFNTETWDRTRVLEGHTGSVLSLAWSPDGAYLASGEGSDRVLVHNKKECQNVIKIGDATSGQELRTLTGHQDGILSLSWSSDNQRLATASDDKNLKMWNPITGELLFTLGEGVGHSSGVLDVDWSPDQTRLVSGSRDFKIRVWYANNGTPIGKPWKDHNCVRSTDWHPAGEYILTAGVDQTIKIRNATTGEEIKVFEEATETNSEVMSARWSPDGRKIAAASTRDGSVRLYAIGFDESGESTLFNDWRVGISIFTVILAIGLVLIYIPLRNEFRAHRK
jgi:WD40 repeat protein